MEEIKRDRWGGRLPFIMAAIGSAVGLGNVWRFPYVAFNNGGGAFLVPYFIALITAGIPLMILEYALGQKFQSGPPKAMGKINKGFKWVGWMALLIGLSISFYYVVIMAYCWVFAFASPGLKWTKPVDPQKYIVVTKEKGETYEDMLIKKEELAREEAKKPEGERKIVLTQDENVQVYFNEVVLGGFHDKEWRKASLKEHQNIIGMSEGPEKTKALEEWKKTYSEEYKNIMGMPEGREKTEALGEWKKTASKEYQNIIGMPEGPEKTKALGEWEKTYSEEYKNIMGMPEGREKSKALEEWEKDSSKEYQSIMGMPEGTEKTKSLEEWKKARDKKYDESFTLVPHLLLFTFLTWLIIFLIIFRGVKYVGKVVMFTVPIPIILLGVLIVQGLTLPGAGRGIEFFLSPNWGLLKDPGVWLAAYGQIFFSLSLGFGILIAYASYQPEESDVSNNAFMTSFCNCATSFYASFAVFSVLGYLAVVLNKPDVGEVVKSGPGLVFVAYPMALAHMGDIGRFVGVLFFVSLLTLGIDSAFSIVEGVITGIHDYTKKMSREILALIICVIGFIFSLPFCLKSGMMWLDIVDNWMSNYGLVFVGLLECIAVGYFFTTAEIRNYVNERSEIKLGMWWDALIKFVTPTVLIYLLASGFIGNILKPYGGYNEIFAQSVNIAGWGYFAFLLTLAFALGRNWYAFTGVISLVVITLILTATKLSLAASAMGALGIVLLIGGFLACLSIALRQKNK